MNEILFLLFAFLTIFLSIKLSYYADRISKTSTVSKALIGGVVLAGVTSLPEFVTCFSAIMMGNPTMAIGDILGSNLFNIFMVCFFDIIFMKKMLFSKTARSHNLILFILIVNYVVMYLFVNKIFDFSLLSVGIPSVIIIITYIFYIKSIPKFEDSEVVINNSNDSNLVLKLAITAILMIMSSVMLTFIVNNLSIIYPAFSSSFLGAIFLGITTSLPEVITFYTLINIDSYDLALSNIVGSNLFNLLVLAFGDIFGTNYSIYNFSDRDTISIVVLGFLFTLICLISNNRKNVKNSFSYIVLSVVIVVIYLSFWITNFINN